MFDFITIGSAGFDAFIETDKASIVSVSAVGSKREFMAYPYGSKIEIDDFRFETGGGGVNTAVNFSNLGLKTAAAVKIGDDIQSGEIELVLKNAGVDLSFLVKTKEYQTGFSIILTSFQGDRTVLAHRGANAKLFEKDIDFNALKNTKWIYLAPLNGDTAKILNKIADFAEENNIKLAVNPGTTSIKQGKEHLYSILKAAEIIIMNKEEASMLTNIQVRPDTKTEKFSKEIIHPDIIKMMKEIRPEKDSITVITDGRNGAYAYDGKHFYRCGAFPADVVSTLGAGDAFASTFAAALEYTKGDIVKSLKYASVNAASAASCFSAQEGLLNFEEIKKRLSGCPDFEVNII